MQRDRERQIEFHIRGDDYFGTAATVIALVRETLGDAQVTPLAQRRSLRLLDRLKEDFLFLQARYSITHKAERHHNVSRSGPGGVS